MIAKDNLRELRRLTKLLPNTPNGHPVVSYDVGSGSSVGYGLLKTDDIAVQSNVLEAGTKFPYHTHTDIREWIIVYKGEIIFTLEGGEEVLVQRGECITLDPGQSHCAYAPIECHLIGVTVPADKGYPDASDES